MNKTVVQILRLHITTGIYSISHCFYGYVHVHHTIMLYMYVLLFADFTDSATWSSSTSYRTHSFALGSNLLHRYRLTCYAHVHTGPGSGRSLKSTNMCAELCAADVAAVGAGTRWAWVDCEFAVFL